MARDESLLHFGDNVVLRNVETKRILMPSFKDPVDEAMIALQESDGAYPQVPDAHIWWLTLGPYVVGDPNLNLRLSRQDEVRDSSVITLRSPYARGKWLAIRTPQRTDSANYPVVGVGNVNDPDVRTSWRIQGVTKLKPLEGGGFAPADDSSPTGVFRYGETFVKLSHADFGHGLKLSRGDRSRIYRLAQDAKTTSDWWIVEKAAAPAP